MNTPDIRELPVDQIWSEQRLRPADEAAVEALALDIKERDLRDPIKVYEIDGQFRLSDGFHRLSAYRALGWGTIPARVLKGTEQDRQLDEVCALLVRADPSQLDRSVFVSKWKGLYVAANPEAAHGGDRRSGDFQEGTMPSWSEALSQRTGWGVDTLKRCARIGEGLKPELIDDLRRTPAADSQKDLLYLAKFGPNSSMQGAIIDLLKSGAAKSAVQAHKQASDTADSDPEDRAEVFLKKFYDLWNRAPEGARRSFLNSLVETGFENLRGRALGWIEEG